MMHEERQQLRQHERKTQYFEVNEEQLARETSEDEVHVNDLFLKKHQDTNERGSTVNRTSTW